MRNKIKAAMDDMLQKNVRCDYIFTQNGKEMYIKNIYALDAYLLAFNMSKEGDVKCYMASGGRKAYSPVFTAGNGIAVLSGQII